MVERSKKPSAIPVTPSAPAAHVEFSPDNTRVTATLPTGESIEVLLYGAHVISWKCGGRENLFMSDKAHLDGSKAVRGGVPLVFPLFGPPPATGATSALSQHGFARTSRWEFLNKSTSEATTTTGNNASGSSGADQDNNVKLDFGLSSANLSPEASKAWPYKFGIIYSITLTRTGLETSMCVRNEGSEIFDFQMLFHTYLRIKNISETTVSGLSGLSYLDKTATPHTPKKQEDQELSFRAETDRVYAQLPEKTNIVVNESGKASFEIIRDNLDDVVVWNPWVEKSAGMTDFGPSDAWKEMLCVEPGAVSQVQRLDSGDTFEGGQIMRSLL